MKQLDLPGNVGRTCGQIEPSTSEWFYCSNCGDSTEGWDVTVCGNNRCLNTVILADAYPMPRIDKLLDRNGQVKYITTMDMT